MGAALLPITSVGLDIFLVPNLVASFAVAKTENYKLGSGVPLTFNPGLIGLLLQLTYFT